MHRHQHWHYLAAWVTFAVAVVVPWTSDRALAAAPLTVGELRCEYLRDPLGIDAVRPRLSWVITSDRRGVRQAAYRILVASSIDALNRDNGDRWDSGRVESDQSVHVEYSGPTLASGQACFWKVRVWDDAGQATDRSPAASWSMGLMHADDWKGEWIGPAVSADDAKRATSPAMPPPAPLLRKAFAIDKPVKRATAYVCGLGYYELFLNGRRVGDHVLDPPITQYDKRVLYVTYDVTKQLSDGPNAFGVVLGSSWYDGTVTDAWDLQKAPWRALPQLRMQVEVEFTDGSRQTIASDGSWKLSTGPVLFDQMRVGEVYDARLETPGWTTARYDDSKWSPVARREGPRGRLVASMVEPIRVIDTLKPVSIKEPKPGVFIFDIGQNLAGWPRLTLSGAAGTKVRLRCSDWLKPDGTIDMTDIGRFVHSADVQCDTYTLKGDGVEVWEPSFTYHGFQYVQVEGLPASATPTDETVVARVVHTAFEPTGSFECSNELLNKVERAAVWSYVSNFVGFPTDCPQREKNGWTGDAQLAVRMGLEHFDAQAAYGQWINTLEDAMRDDGKLPCVAPTAGWGYNTLDGPAWESAYLLVPWEIYQQSGDRRILESHYDGFKRWIDWYTRGAKDHIVTYGLGDWAPVKTKTPAALTSTAYYYRDLLIVAETARLLGKGDEEAQFRALADEVRRAFNATFFDPNTGQYANGSQTALACALYQGMVDDANRARVVQNLVDAVHSAGDHIDTGILGAKYILRALADNGHADVAWQIASQRTSPSWGNWIDRGATTLWESWDGHDSRNHIMFGDIGAWFIEYVAGIRPDEAGPGYRKIIIHPMLLGDLAWARATRRSMQGTIRSEWKRTAGKLTLNVTIPAGCGATVFIPTDPGTTVLEGGKALTEVDGVKLLHRDGEAAVMHVVSGTYSFESPVSAP